MFTSIAEATRVVTETLDAGEGGAGAFDVDAITRETFEWVGRGFRQALTGDDFWACVFAHAVN